MVAEPPKVTSTFVVLLASLVMQRIFAASLFIIPALPGLVWVIGVHDRLRDAG